MVLSHDEAVRWVDEQRSHGRTIVFTNGVFDLLHPGHVRYLREARALGDALIVAVNSDRSARALEKGPGRPLNTAAERAAVVFDEDTPHEIVVALQPDVLAKGADWAEGTIVGADVVEARGGRVVRITLAEGYSTSRLVEKVRGK
jgi:rfaE bifunctional protein nucleotidyltransferase chain/domain